MRETLLKNQILDYLKYKGIFCWPVNTMGNFNVHTNSYYKNPRLLSGVADIIGLLPDGRFLAIECKTGKNKQTSSQIEFQRGIEANHGVYFLAYQLEDAEIILNIPHHSVFFPFDKKSNL